LSCIALCMGTLAFQLYYLRYCGYPTPRIDAQANLTNTVINAQNASRLSVAFEAIGDERHDVGFSSDDRWLVVTGLAQGWTGPLTEDPTGTCLTIWTLSLDEQPSVHYVHDRMDTMWQPRTDFAIDPVSERIVLGTRSVIDLATGAELHRLDTSIFHMIGDIAFTADGRYIVASDGISAAIWDGETYARIDSLLPIDRSIPSERQFQYQFVQSGEIIQPDVRQVVIWDIAEQEVVRRHPVRSEEFRILDANREANLIAYNAVVRMNDDITFLLDLETGIQRQFLDQEVTSLRFSPSGSVLVARINNRLAVIETATAREIADLGLIDQHTRLRTAFHISNTILAVASNQGKIELFDLHGQLLRTLPVAFPIITDIQFNLSSTLLAATAVNPETGEGGLWVWQVE
jgi:WD40 repeat protein